MEKRKMTPDTLTSEKLVNLQNQYRDAFKAMQKIDDPLSAEAKDAKMALWKIDGEIKAEEASLQKAANEAKIAEARQARIQLNRDQFAAYDNLAKIRADKKATPEAIAEAETAFNTAREKVENELLAKFASGTSAKKASSTDGEKSGKSSENKDAIIALFLDGKSLKEIEESGYARSTVWHTVNNYKKANGL